MASSVHHDRGNHQPYGTSGQPSRTAHDVDITRATRPRRSGAPSPHPQAHATRGAVKINTSAGLKTARNLDSKKRGEE